jgi:hypothetical protein
MNTITLLVGQAEALAGVPESALLESLIGQVGTGGAIVLVLWLMLKRLLATDREQRDLDRAHQGEIVGRVCDSFESHMNTEREARRLETELLAAAIDGIKDGQSSIVERLSKIETAVASQTASARAVRP